MLPGDMMQEGNETIHLTLGVDIVRCQSCDEPVETEGNEDLTNTACPNCSCFLVTETEIAYGAEEVLQ